MTARVVLVVLLVTALAPATAMARWTAGGGGTGAAATADMPTGATPSVSVSGRSVTVTWAQNAFTGSTLGARGGGYTLARYAESDLTTPITPGAGCAGTRTGATDPQTCTETNVPFGRWVYRVTPVIDSFVGTQGPQSPVAAVVLAAPVLTSVVAQNPTNPTGANTATGTTDGPVAVTWEAVPNATGYEVLRRIGTGAFTTLTATPTAALSYSDTTATGGQTYSYVVRAVSTPPATTSTNSNERTAQVVTRAAAPTTVTATSVSGAVSVSWTGAARASGYNVYRRRTNAPVTQFDYTAAPVNGASPVTGTTFKDTTVLRAATYSYAVRSVVPGAGTSIVESASSSPTAAAQCSAGYRAAVRLDAPTDYFRLGDGSTVTALNEQSTLRNGRYTNATVGAAGALACDTNTAATFNGTNAQVLPAATAAAVAGPNTFSISVWFKTSVAGGKLVGFGNVNGAGASDRYDRHLYIDANGKLVFGVYPGELKIVRSSGAVTDNAWHLATATLGSTGQRLYLDGALVASAEVFAGESYTGYWRIGYDNLNAWTDQPSNPFFTGNLDEVAIFPTQLSAAQIATHYTAGKP